MNKVLVKKSESEAKPSKTIRLSARNKKNRSDSISNPETLKVEDKALPMAPFAEHFIMFRSIHSREHVLCFQMNFFLSSYYELRYQFFFSDENNSRKEDLKIQSASSVFHFVT